MMFDDRNRPPMFDDQMWSPPIIPPPVMPGPGVFDVVRVTSFHYDPPAPVAPRLHPDDLEAIARRVAELLRGAP